MNFAISSKSEASITSFEEFYNSFSAKLSTKLTLIQPITSFAQRNISQIGSSNDNNSGRGNERRESYRGKGRGRIEYQGRGYRGRGRGGRGRGRGRKDYRPYQRQNFVPRTSEYKYEECSSLSHAQQSRIQGLRGNIRENNSRSNYRTNDRNIRQMLQDDETIPSQVNVPPPSSNINPTPPHGDQGSNV